MSEDEIKQIVRNELIDSYRRVLAGPITACAAPVRGVDLQYEIDRLTALVK